MEKAIQAGRLFSRFNSVINFFSSKKTAIVEIIASLLILLFVYTAVSKLSGLFAFESVLKKSPLIGDYAAYIKWGVPIVELIISASLFYSKTRRIGMFASAILMFGFTAYIGYMIAFTPNLPCSCGGVLSQMNWNQHLIFNIIFTILPIVAILLMRKRTSR
jgi:putative oxidoreductase